MKVLHITTQTCIRTIKQILTQHSWGWEPMLMTQKMTHPDLMPYLGIVVPWGSPETVRHWVDYADVVHIHTTLADHKMAVAFWGDHHIAPALSKVVWDIHDYQTGKPDIDYLRIADSIICPSEGYATTFRQHHDNVHVIYSKPPRALKPPHSEYKNYTTVCLPAVLDQDVVFRDYRQVNKMLHDSDFELHVYSAANPSKLKDQIHVYELLKQADLYRRMSHYQYGWAGAANDRHNIDNCVTNKFWDYLACGVQPITWRSREMTEICKVFNVGAEWPNIPSPNPVKSKDIFFLDGDKKLFERAYQ